MEDLDGEGSCQSSEDEERITLAHNENNCDAPLHVAWEVYEAVQQLMVGFEADGWRNGFTPLHFAAQFGHVDVLKIMLGVQTKADVVDNCGRIPLHMAAIHGQAEALRRLNRTDAPLDSFTTDGYSPLGLAVVNGNLKIVEALLAAGANPGMRKRCSTESNPTGIQSAVAGSGAASTPSVGPRNERRSPLFLAASSGHADIVAALLLAGAKPEQATGWEECFDAKQKGRTAIKKRIVCTLIRAPSFAANSWQWPRQIDQQAQRQQQDAAEVATVDGKYQMFKCMCKYMNKEAPSLHERPARPSARRWKTFKRAAQCVLLAIFVAATGVLMPIIIVFLYTVLMDYLSADSDKM